MEGGALPLSHALTGDQDEGRSSQEEQGYLRAKAAGAVRCMNTASAKTAHRQHTMVMRARMRSVCRRHFQRREESSAGLYIIQYFLYIGDAIPGAQSGDAPLPRRSASVE